MQPTILLTVLVLLGALVGLIALLMFGSSVLDGLKAILRIIYENVFAVFRLVGKALLALGWYLAGVILLLSAVGGGIAYWYWYRPGGFNLTRYRPPLCTELLDRNGKVLDYLCPFDGVRVWRPLESISPNLRALVVMLEDDKFYEHGGLDVDEIWSSLETDLERHKLARGGSTITQQLAKNLFLTKEKTLIRKASEVPITLRLERELDKDQILELYLNTIEWGPGIYGAEAASRLYFDHPAATLSMEEAWLLALMIPNPRELNPWVAPRARHSLLNRAKHLATRLYIEHRMSKEEAKAGFARFEAFLASWERAKPESLYAGRKYPARWAENHDFSISEVVSIRRHAGGLLKRLQPLKPLRLKLDLAIQSKLEKLQADVHAHDLSDVLAVMDGNDIRGLIPIESPQLVEMVAPIAKEEGWSTQVFHARNIPATALMPQ